MCYCTRLFFAIDDLRKQAFALIENHRVVGEMAIFHQLANNFIDCRPLFRNP